MKGKLIIVCVVALGALPSAASASSRVELTYPQDTRLTAGSTLKGQSGGVNRATNAGGGMLWECGAASLTGTLAKNDGAEVAADIESLSFSGTASESRCTSTFGNLKITTAVENGVPWCVKATTTMADDEFTLRGGKCSEAARQIRIIADSSAIGECKYEREAVISGTFSTEPNDAVLTVSAAELIKFGGGFLCPSVLKLDLSLTPERDEEGTNPVYFTLPPTPEITYPTGTQLATSSKLKAHNIGELNMTGAALACTTAELTGTLNKNNGSEIEATITGANISGTGVLADCTSSLGDTKVTTNVSNGLPWCLRSTFEMHNDEFQLRGGDCAEAARPIKFVLDATFSIGECAYGRSTALSGTFTTHPEDAVLTISEAAFTKEAGSFLCPGSVKLDWSFTLERDEEGTKPIYIS